MLWCALSKENKCRKLEVTGDDQQQKPTTIQHFSHPHNLRLFNSRWNSAHCRCKICKDLVKGPAYGCVECGFYLHISCAEFPLEIQHPYHPQHPLRASATTFDEQCSSWCKMCRENVGLAVYQCRPCRLALDMDCANQTLLSTPLKHECHQHNLYHIIGSGDDGGEDEEEEEETDDGEEEDDTNRGSDDGEDEDEENDDGEGEDKVGTTSDDLEDQDPDQKSHKEQCNACNKYCVKSYYQCLECKYIIHLKCMGLPATVDYSCHLHPLTLVEKFVEDDSGLYYCHACGQERNPEYPVYVCKECPEDVPFAAHIECVVSEETDIPFNSGLTVSDDPGVESYPALVEFDEAKRKPKCKVQIETKDFENDHALTIHERGIPLWLDQTCYGCKRSVEGGLYYICNSCDHKFHKLCAELPLMIRHPLHSQHPLTFLPPNDSQAILCDGCGNFTFDGGYKCGGCQFMLDIKCASLNTDQFQNSQHRKVTISHSFHVHKLTLTTHNVQEEYWFACQVPILSTPYYSCLPCQVFIHGRCLEIPQERQHPYHPQHPLFIKNLHGSRWHCSSCKLIIKGLGYCCNQCGFGLHTRCADYVTSTLESKSHKHVLYCFAKLTPEEFPSILSRYGPAYDKSAFNCQVCAEQCLGSFYRCVKCNMNFHFDCLSIPHKVKHQCHFDPLILADSMCEDDSGEYYCEICTELRNPNHGVYHCKKCMVFAHIGCVLVEVEDTLET
ncbi:hypothetical protein Tsubulata_011519 [Turnera subulata]|uniref:Phorbol-ester/DAG-type domain-containing protein n=1 Tax=Turnera subulata TaxID=218843 RepID=A0A9Q0IZ65_9ROSI|nr:hypothetical protein Tsubulata_011519 [Turnera subulata]